MKRDAESVRGWRDQLEELKQLWRKTTTKDKEARRKLKLEFGIVYRGLEDCGIGRKVLPKNTPPEHRDKFSIWHIRNQRVEIPPTLNRIQAVECLTNGSCGD